MKIQQNLSNISLVLYYFIKKIIVSRCDCYGHGTECTFDDAAKPNPKYVCKCNSRTFTRGEQVRSSFSMIDVSVIV